MSAGRFIMNPIHSPDVPEPLKLPLTCIFFSFT